MARATILLITEDSYFVDLKEIIVLVMIGCFGTSAPHSTLSPRWTGGLGLKERQRLGCDARVECLGVTSNLAIERSEFSGYGGIVNVVELVLMQDEHVIALADELSVDLLGFVEFHIDGIYLVCVFCGASALPARPAADRTRVGGRLGVGAWLVFRLGLSGIALFLPLLENVLCVVVIPRVHFVRDVVVNSGHAVVLARVVAATGILVCLLKL